MIKAAHNTKSIVPLLYLIRYHIRLFPDSIAKEVAKLKIRDLITIVKRMEAEIEDHD